MVRKDLSLALLLLLAGGVVPGGCRAERFDLSRIKDYARKHSPVLQAKASEIGIQRGERTRTRAAMLPTLSAEGGYTRYRLEHGVIEGVFGGEQQVDDQRLFGGLRFNFMAFNFGKNFFAYRGASSLVTSKNREYEREWQNIVFDLSRLYYSILTVDKTMAATRKTIESLRALEQEIKKKVEVERLPEVDLLKVEVNLARSIDDLSRSKTLRQQLTGELRRLMGYEEARELQLKEEPIKKVAPVHFRLEQLLDTAYRSRDDLRSLKASIRSKEYQKKSVKASYMPRIDLQATYTEQAPGSGNFKADAAAGVAVSMPLFDGLSRKGTLERLAAEKNRLHSLLRAQRLEVEKEVKTALSEYRESLVRLETSRRSVAHAREVLKIEKLRYDLGRSTIDFLLGAEGALLTARSLFYQAYYDQVIALANIQLAVGRLK